MNSPHTKAETHKYRYGYVDIKCVYIYAWVRSGASCAHPTALALLSPLFHAAHLALITTQISLTLVSSHYKCVKLFVVFSSITDKQILCKYYDHKSPKFHFVTYLSKFYHSYLLKII